MTSLSRRGAIKLASSFLATAPILMRGRRAQAAAEPGLVVLDMASFGGAGVDADTAFAKAIAAIEKAAADARKGGGPVHIVLQSRKGRYLPDQTPPRLQAALTASSSTATARS